MLDEGRFYPIKSMKAEERLWWYSQFFDCVEVNSTFYAPLSADNAVRWVKRTPTGFLFSVKAYGAPHRASPGRGAAARAAARHAAGGSAPQRARADREPAVPPRGVPVGVRERFAKGCARSRTAASSATCCSRWHRGSSTRRRRSTISRACPSGCPASPSPWSSGTPRGCPRTPTRSCASSPRAASPTCPSTRRGRRRAVATTVALTSPVAVLRLHGRNAAGFLKQLHGALAERGGKVRLSLRRGRARGRSSPRHGAWRATRAASTSSSTTMPATRPPSTASRSGSCSARTPPTAPTWRRSGVAVAARCPALNPRARMAHLKIVDFAEAGAVPIYEYECAGLSATREPARALPRERVRSSMSPLRERPSYPG